MENEELGIFCSEYRIKNWVRKGLTLVFVPKSDLLNHVVFIEN